MRLKRLRIQNFRSFLDSTVEFPERGMVLIRGRDLATGESSGTGKTAVFLGIAYALDCLPPGFTAKALKCWFSKDDLQVTLTLDVDGREVIVSRGKETSIDYGDRKVSGAKAYAEELPKLVKIPLTFLTALTYRPQDTKGLFVSMEPSEKIEFLIELLGLGQIVSAVETANAAADDFNDSLVTVESNIGIEQSRFDAYQSNRPSPPAPLSPPVEMAALESSLVAVKAQIAELDRKEKELAFEHQTSVASRLQELDAEIAQARQFEANLLDADRKRQVAAQNEAKARSEERLSLQRKITRLEGIQQECVRVERMIAKMRENKCPTCDQPWSAEHKLEDLEVQLASSREELAGFPAVSEELSKLLAKSQPTFESDPRLAICRDVARRLSDEKFKVSTRSDQSDGLGVQKQSLVRQNNELVKEIAVLKSLMDRHEVEKTDYAKRLMAHEIFVTGVQTALDGLKAKKERVGLRLAAERDFVAAMGKQGFLGKIVEEVLFEISDEATKWLGRLANANRIGVIFSTETEKGRQQIKLLVDVRGNRAKPEAVLSGGQLTSLAQAIDLAMMSVISRRRGGVVPGWLCLDEVFNGQGLVTKEGALEIIKELSENRLVLVIDHGTETAEVFSRTVNIEFNEGTSKVV
jgi:DNA repair exonuclease SbcCD ATPase subunit